MFDASFMLVFALALRRAGQIARLIKFTADAAEIPGTLQF